METKICSRCGELLTLDKFHNNPRYKSGVIGQCRKCVQEMRTNRYHKNPNIYKKKEKEWRDRTPELSEKRRISTYIKYLSKRNYTITKNSTK